MERLKRTKVLIVLDDVDTYLPFEKLAWCVEGLCLGSRIIITSRDKHVLQLFGVNDQKIFEVKGFNDHDALQLFCNYAFRENYPPEDRTVLSNELVNYSKGNPLALKVLGSSLYRKSKQEWESVVNKLRTTNLNRGIFDVLKISYDGLEDSEKNIFLDIACFFKGKTRGYVEKIIGDCCYSLCVLNDKSLITISSYDMIYMHDLLEEMGREIVDKESPNKPGERRWLWRQQEVQNTLKYDEGTNAVQGIVLDLSNIKDMQLSPQAFKKMYNLRFLKFDVPWCFDGPYNSKVHFPNGLSDLSGKLRSLTWHEFPLRALPSNFIPENLVELDLRESNLERLWEDTMHVPNLKLLILHGCKHLTNIPDLSNAPLLEKIDLNRCQSLLDFPPLAPHLKYLHFLDLEGCISLRSFQSDIHFESITSLVLRDRANLTKFPEISGYLIHLDLSGTAIDKVPPSIGSLTNLFDLNLSQCTRLKHISTNICKLKSLHQLNLANCSALESFPEISGDLGSLDLRGSAINEVPPSIGSLTKLSILNLSQCTRLKHISTNICKLKSLHELNLANCSALESFPEISGDLRDLDLSGTAIDEVPPSIGSLTKLSNFNLSQCTRLKHISIDICKLKSLHKLTLKNCSALESFPEISENLKELNLSGTAIDRVPSSIVSLTQIEVLSLSECTKLKHISTDICKLKSLQQLYLKNCSELEIFPETWETMEGLQFLDLSGTAIKELPHRIENLNGLRGLWLERCKNLEELPSSICHLTSLRFLYLSDCSKLEILPDNFGNLKSLMTLSIARTAISQLQSTMMHLKVLDRLCLSDCNLKEIPEDICHLSLLVDLDLSGNDFESLPKSMKQLSKLRYLKVNNCNMLQSLTELPLSIRFLSASDCKQLRSIPDASELVNAEFIFINCPSLEETAVSNILATVEGYEGKLDWFSFICPGSEVPERFSYKSKSKSNESSIKFQMARNDCFNGLLPEFIVCAVIEFEEYPFDANGVEILNVKCRWTFSDGDESDPLTGFSSCTLIGPSRTVTLINSDHVALWHITQISHVLKSERINRQVPRSKFTNRQVLKSEFTNCSFEFLLGEENPKCRMKSCGAWPVTKISNEDDKVEYAKPINKFGETSRKRSRTFNDHWWGRRTRIRRD